MSRAVGSRRAGLWELLWAAALALMVAMATSLPYLYGDLQASANEGRYLGFVFNPDEPNVHLSWIEQARQGEVFFHNAFTSEPHEGRFFNLFMLAAGRVARAAGLTSYQIWAIARLLAAACLGLACYWAMAQLTARHRHRRFGLLVLLLSSGLGWYSGTPAAWPFLEALPLLSISLLMLGLGALERAFDEQSWCHAVAGLAAGVLLHGVPRADALLLVLFTVARLAALRALSPEGGFDTPLWRWRGGLALALVLLTRPTLRFEAEWPAIGWLLVAVALAAYYLLVISQAGQPLARARWIVVGLAAVIGWTVLGPVLGLDAVDVEPNLVMPEAITFLSIYLNPLFSISMALLVSAMILGRVAILEERWEPAVGAGVCGLVLANIHTYDAVPLLLCLTLWLAVRMGLARDWLPGAAGAWLVIVLLVLPGIWYQAHLINSDPLYHEKAFTQTLTPGLLSMLVSYGLLVPLAFVGAMALVGRQGSAAAFWPLWAMGHALCLFLPPSLFPFQRKMAEGLHIPLALLAAYALAELASRLAGVIAGAATAPRYREAGPTWAVRCDHACRRRGWLPFLATVGGLLLIPSNVAFVGSTLAALRNNNAAKWSVAMPPFWVPEAEGQALDWMAAHLPPEAVVGCLPYVGSYLPGRCGVRVYCGHWAETLGFRDKLTAISSFYREPGTAAAKLQFLREAGITYLYYGAWELAATGGQLPQFPALELVYPPHPESEGPPEVAIYRVREAAPASASAPVRPANP